MAIISDERINALADAYGLTPAYVRRVLMTGEEAQDARWRGEAERYGVNPEAYIEARRRVAQG